MAKVDYSNLIHDLGEAGKNNKSAMSGILYRYNIAKVETLERRVLDYIFNIDDDELRFKFIDIIVEANNLPIISCCYSIISSNASQTNCYLKQKFDIKHELCMGIIAQSSLLQERQRIIAQYSQTTSDGTNIGCLRVISHKERKKARIRY